MRVGSGVGWWVWCWVFGLLGVIILRRAEPEQSKQGGDYQLLVLASTHNVRDVRAGGDPIGDAGYVATTTAALFSAAKGTYLLLACAVVH